MPAAAAAAAGRTDAVFGTRRLRLAMKRRRRRARDAVATPPCPTLSMQTVLPKVGRGEGREGMEEGVGMERPSSSGPHPRSSSSSSGGGGGSARAPVILN